MASSAELSIYGRDEDFWCDLFASTMKGTLTVP